MEEPIRQAEFERNLQFYKRRVTAHLRTHIRRFLPVPPRLRRLPGPENQASHWVLCFFGIDRSLRYTIYGINRHILAPLKRRGISVTIVAHFNQIDRIPGHYSRESRVDFRRDSISCLNPDVLWVERQTDNAIAAEMKQLEGVEWKEKTPLFSESKKNLMHQLHSLSRVSELVRMAAPPAPDVFALLRADLQYLDDLDVEGIQTALTSATCDIITPVWQKWGGLNDRFAFVHPDAVHAVLNRREFVSDFVRTYGYIHAEELLLFVADRYCLKKGFTSMRAERVRGSGRVQFEGFGEQ